MNRKYYILVILLFSASILLAVYYNSAVSKYGEVTYYITKKTGSCTSEKEKEVHIKNYIIQKDDPKTVFSETLENGKGSLMYMFSERAVEYLLSEKGELTNKAVIDLGDYRGYLWWGLYITPEEKVKPGDVWEGDVKIRSQNIGEESTITEISFHCRSEVLSYEEIKVKAGDFKCYKIKLTQEGEYKINNEKKIVKYTITLWYSPDLRIIIKDSYISQFGDFECRSTSELIEYG